LHFPKAAVGYWPPVFEFLQASAFLVFGTEEAVALVLQAIFAGLCAAIAAAVWSRISGLVAGALSSSIVLFSPICLNMIDEVMADTLLAATVTLTAVAWSLIYIVELILRKEKLAQVYSICACRIDRDFYKRQRFRFGAAPAYLSAGEA